LLTGGSILAIIALWQMATGKPIPQAVNWLVLGCTFVVAAFLAWRREWIEAGRSFIEAKPRDLVELCRDRTEVHARSLTRQYLSKWMKVEGRLIDVSIGAIVWPAMVSLETEDEVDVFLHLARWRARPFLPLPIGTLVTVIGRIDSIDSFHICLTNGELISAGEASTQLSTPPTPTPGQ
jgi:hypothetical protein